MSPDVGLIESFYASADGAPWLARHLRRLFSSARVLAIACEEHAVEEQTREVVRSICQPSKVRLELSPDGRLLVDVSPLRPLPSAPAAIIAKRRLLADDPMLRHKTTRRDVYDMERQRLSAVPFGFDVIFLNDRDEIAEGAISNVFAAFGNVMLTPPSGCGLLPGVMRAELIGMHGAKEQVLTLDDLRSADRIIMTNAVRGAVEVDIDFDYED